MPWTVERDEAFVRALKDLSRKFPRAEKDILEEFASGPPQHTDALPSYAHKLWKARVGSTDLNRGRRGGFRVIYYYDAGLPNWCCLGTCYFKGDRETLTAAELTHLFASVKARAERVMEIARQSKPP